MGQTATETTIVYGDIIARNERQKLEHDSARSDGSLDWHDEPDLFRPNNDPATVFVDLDDPRFSSSEFLVSIATAGEKVRIIGKSNSAGLDNALHYS